MKDDCLHVRLDELQQLLSNIEEPEIEDLQPSAVTEDEEVYSAEIVAEEQADEEEAEDIHQEEYPYTCARFEPYPTPSLSPEAGLLAGLLSEAVKQASNTATIDDEDFEPWMAAFAAGRLIQPVEGKGRTVTKATIQRLARRPNGLQTIHGLDLPPLPKSHYQLQSHPLGTQFLQAEEEHLQSHIQKQSWSEADKQQAQGHQVLDCMWVYTYKFNPDGIFKKYKARIVVRGD